MSPTKIMIVEDEVIAAMATARMLQKLGFDVCGNVSSGEEALLAFEGKCPDIIIMDIRLDGELDGIETTRRMKMRRDIPVIFVTAYSDDCTRTRAEATKPLAFINKPLDMAQLRRILSDLRLPG
ncbi:MAG: response regulator [Acidobacteriota bacterium]